LKYFQVFNKLEERRSLQLKKQTNDRRKEK
jgi:hypothetical protein